MYDGESRDKLELTTVLKLVGSNDMKNNSEKSSITTEHNKTEQNRRDAAMFHARVTLYGWVSSVLLRSNYGTVIGRSMHSKPYVCRVSQQQKIHSVCTGVYILPNSNMHADIYTHTSCR